MRPPLKILCTGGLHVGRRPSRLAWHINAGKYSCAIAWDAIFDYVIRGRVDVLLVSRNWVNRGNRFYEALGPIERGLLADGRHNITTRGRA